MKDEVHLDRKPCFDDGCIGTINDQGTCNECGRTRNEIESGIQSKTKTPEKVVMLPLTKPGWGWGWLILFGLYVKSIAIIDEGKYFISPLASIVIELVGFVVTLFLYFKLRRLFIDKNRFPQKVWTGSLKAGIVAYIFILLVVGISAFVGAYYENRSIGKEIEAIFKETSIDKLNRTLHELDQINDITTIKSINKALRTLKTAIPQLSKTEKTIRKFISFTEVHEKELKHLHSGLFLTIKDMTVRGANLKYFKSLKDYLSAYENLLVFSRDNLDKISRGQGLEWDKYDKLYDIFIKASKKLNQASFDKQEFVQQFCKEHPEILEFFSEKTKSNLKL